jgi:CheY-like chemotaxis protein
VHALIIEADSWIALMIEDLLGELGYHSLCHATTTEEGAEAVAARCPDLIVCDLVLGADSEIEEMRALCFNRVIPVVFLVAARFNPIECAAGEALIAKPFRGDDLKQAVATVTQLI